MNKNLKYFTNGIVISKNAQFQSGISALTSSIENSILSTIKMNSPLVKIINDKYSVVKKAYPHRIYYIKIFVFSNVKDYKKLI